MSKIEKFLSERGVAAAPPERPLVTYPKYWERTVRWLTAGRQAPDLVRDFGPTRAREILNEVALGTPPIYHTDDRLIPQLARRGRYGFILLPGGCHWALQKEQGGQCAFCEFQEIVDEVAGDLPFSHGEFMALFNAGFATMKHDVDMVNVFTAGSFLNPGEIPPGTQETMARAVASAAYPSIMRVESRVQYMVEESIAPLVGILSAKDKTLDIAIGMETQNDELRKHLRKGMGRSGLVNAIKTAKACGARVSVYVMLMPLDIPMTEGYAVKECIDSIAFAFETGADEVLLQARYSHHPHVQCPKLWSIAEVLERTAHLGPVMLGKWEGELPAPVIWPKNCGVCDPQIMSALARWRETLSASVIAESALPDCACRAPWRESLDDLTPPDLALANPKKLPLLE